MKWFISFLFLDVVLAACSLTYWMRTPEPYDPQPPSYSFNEIVDLTEKAHHTE